MKMALKRRLRLGFRFGRYLTTARVLVIGFLLLIALGTWLFTLPKSSTGEPLSLIDAAFTATSAVCVTGLTVIHAGKDLTFFGQIVLMVLIQIGGLGFMTMTTFIFILMGRRISLKERMTLQDALGESGISGIVALVRRILYMTFAIEGIGALVLSTRFIPMYGLKNGIYYSIFHSISSFCNAGFDLFGGLESTVFTNDVVINLGLMSMIILGGLGYGVMFDIMKHKSFGKFSLQTKIVLITSGVLTLFGMLLIMLFDWNNPESLARENVNIWARPMAALFQSVSTRTAGMATTPQAGWSEGTRIISIILMTIGASPGSTGGGIKTTTIALVILFIIMTVRGRDEISVFKRSISNKSAARAITIVFIYIMVILACTVLLSFETMSEGSQITGSDLLFEVVSGIATVGLSVGITPMLGTLSKITIMLIMFAGRLGPLTIALALTRVHPEENKIRYPEGRLMIG